jgi:hypothetical protein
MRASRGRMRASRGRIMIITSLFRHLGASLLVDCATASLRFIRGRGMGHLGTALLGHLTAHLPGHLPRHLLVKLIALVLGVVLGHLFILCLAFLSDFRCTGLFFNLFTHLLGYIFTVFSGYVLAILLGDLLADLSGLGVALLAGHHRGHWLLNIHALAHRYGAADRLVNSGALLLVLVSSVGDLGGLAILLGDICAVLLRNLLASGSRLVPALLSGLVPTLLLPIHNVTLSVGDNAALLLNAGGTLLLVHCITLLLVGGSTLLIVPVFGDRFLNSTAAFLWCIVALFFNLKITLIVLNIFSLHLASILTDHLINSGTLVFIHSITFLFILGLTLLLILSLALLLEHWGTLLLWNILTLLLRNRLNSGHLDLGADLPGYIIYLVVIDSIALIFVLISALLRIRGGRMRFLNSATLLSRLIPALVLVHSLTRGDTSPPSTNCQQEKTEYLDT